MPSVKCGIDGCAYRNRHGYCRKKTIVLQVTRDDCNELYCLSWATPATRLFTHIMKGGLCPTEIKR